MFIAFRAVAYATLFVGFLLIYLPERVLSWSGIVRPAGIHWAQIVGTIVGSLGALVALWCIITFAGAGRGTPAPFDPPRRLVIRGPYRYVRNPMFIGASFALAGAALFFTSLSLFAFV